MTSIEIKRGYEVLPDNNVRFGIRIANTSDVVISDVEVILDYSESLFKLEGERVQKVGVIPPNGTRTAEFILKPLGCVHQVNIEALISYRDIKYARQRVDMQPKEVHCVCPFLKGKAMPRAQFLELSNSGHSAEMGLNFKGISVERLTSYLVQTCKGRHYKVDDYPVDGGRMLYLASESIGEKAYYLLTALIKEEDGLTQVMLRAVSDKSHGLNGFLNETVAELRHVVGTVQSAQEIGIIKNEQVINIIDSIVQRSNIGGSGGGASVNIKDSVVQRTEFNAGEGKKVEEETEGKKREEERLHREQDQKAREALAEKERQEELRRYDERNIWDNSKRIEKIKSTLILKTQEEIEKSTFLGFGKKKELVDIFTEKDVENQIEVRQNTIGMKFTHIPAGEFMMGEDGHDSQKKPVHKVNISKPFYLGTYHVTQREWKTVMGDNPSNSKGDDLPVEKVSWNDVQEFIKKLNQKEGTDKYRLPSEAEWEYSCRAGTTSRFLFGDCESMLGEYAWYNGNSSSKPHPVGQKKPNLWGLYDMHGNVWEWVQDWWHGNYNGAPSDGSVWEDGGGSNRVRRGGSWSRNAHGCRSVSRISNVPSNRSSYLGFRLLRTL